MSTDQEHQQQRSTAEWLSLGVALLLLAAVVGSVVWIWLTFEDRPAAFTVEKGTARSIAGQFYLPVRITNSGDETASEVLVEGSLAANGEQETASTTFDFVPARAKAEGVLIFSADPAEAEVRVVSYQEP